MTNAPRTPRLVKRTVCLEYDNGDVISYQGPAGFERGVSIQFADGRAHHYAGRRGQERLVRIDTEDGKIVSLAGPHGEEQVVKVETESKLDETLSQPQRVTLPRVQSRNRARSDDQRIPSRGSIIDPLPSHVYPVGAPEPALRTGGAVHVELGLARTGRPPSAPKPRLQKGHLAGVLDDVKCSAAPQVSCRESASK